MRTDMTATGTMSNTVANWRETRRLYYQRAMRPRVLVVDDDRGCREMMAHLLTDEGFETDVASNGQDALDRAHDNPPRIIVLDMMMPVMDGWTFLAHQRYDTALGAIPVVILSAAPAEHLSNIGAAAAVQKPFDGDELLAVIRAAARSAAGRGVRAGSIACPGV
jgi:two-component system chemotaxis response regulator CheY